MMTVPCTQAQKFGRLLRLLSEGLKVTTAGLSMNALQLTGLHVQAAQSTTCDGLTFLNCSGSV